MTTEKRGYLPVTEFEREQIDERTRMALAHEKPSGEVYAATSFWFEGVAGRLVEVKRESAIVANILKMREAGKSLADNANHLNVSGIEGKRGERICRWLPRARGDRPAWPAPTISSAAQSPKMSLPTYSASACRSVQRAHEVLDHGVPELESTVAQRLRAVLAPLAASSSRQAGCGWRGRK